MKMKQLTVLTSCILSFGIVGCSTTGQPSNVAELERQLEAQEKETAELEQSLRMKDAEVQQYKSAASSAQSTQAPLLPSEAKAGECYARLFIPPTYRTSTDQVLKRASSERLELTPASYEWGEEKVLVTEASEDAKVIPAKYEWVKEQVLVKEQSENWIEVPAQYETVTEEILVKPASTAWKKGRGPIERIDNATGEIMCLIETPAEYKSVSKRVMTAAPSTKKVVIPAEYKTVEKRVMVTPPQVQKITIPAEYKTVKVKRVVTPPAERRIEIPAEYQTVSKRELVTEGHVEWRPILCETNVRPDLVSNVQGALKNLGFHPGPVDGVLGRQTMEAVNSYQRSKGLASGQLSIETIKSLGVEI